MPTTTPRSDNDGVVKDSKLTWLARADYDIIPDQLLGYVSVGTGYHPGHLEDGGSGDGPETLTNYELGTKSTLFGGRATWNVAAYYEDFKGFQVASDVTVKNSAGQIISTSQIQQNAQGALGYGLESELAAKLTPLDTLQLTTTLQHTEIKSLLTLDSRLYSVNPADPGANVVNVQGNSLPHAPLFAATLIYDHRFDLANGGALVPRIGTHFETMSWLSYFNEKNEVGGVKGWDQQNAYTRTDASLSYHAPNERYEIEAYVKNLENNNIKANAYVYTTGTTPVPLAIYEPPLTFGAKFRIEF